MTRVATGHHADSRKRDARSSCCPVREPSADASAGIGIGRGGVELDHAACRVLAVPGFSVQFLVAQALDERGDSGLGLIEAFEQLGPGQIGVVAVELLGEITELVPGVAGSRELGLVSAGPLLMPGKHQFIPADQVGDQIGGAHHRVGLVPRQGRLTRLILRHSL